MSEVTAHNRTVVDQHNLQAPSYARLTTKLAGNEDRAALLRQRIGARADDLVIDVACGPGRLTLELAPHVARITGLDLTPGMLDQARAALAATGLTNAAFVPGDALAMPFADASFTLAISSAAFHHFETPAGVLAEMARVCRPGGRIAVSDVMPPPEKSAGYDTMEKMRDPSHGHAHSIAELSDIGRALGLGEPAVHPGVSGPMPFAAVLTTSFPTGHTRDELLALMREDALSGADRFGFSAQMAGDEVLVSYPTTLIVWTKSG